MAAEIDVVAAAVVDALTIGSGPSALPPDAVTDWNGRIRRRVTRTAERASAKKPTGKLVSTDRIAVRALSEAALTDDPVVQEYLAGILAAATDASDNVHLLALVSRLSAAPIRLHFLVYWGTACFVRDEDDLPGDWRSMATRGVEALDTKFVTSPGAVGVSDAFALGRSLDILERDGLLRDIEDYTHSRVAPVFAFQLTRLGVELFSASLGFDDLDLGSLLCEHPSSLLLDVPLSTVWVDRFADYAAESLQSRTSPA